jgi:hypothetical protein
VGQVTEGLYRKMFHARETRAVVVTTPTAIKSFALKFVEIMHTLDGTSIQVEGQKRSGFKALFGLSKVHYGGGGHHRSASGTH